MYPFAIRIISPGVQCSGVCASIESGSRYVVVGVQQEEEEGNPIAESRKDGRQT